MNISSLTFLLFLSFFSDLGGVKASICTEFACTCEQTFSNLFVTCTLLGNNSNSISLGSIVLSSSGRRLDVGKQLANVTGGRGVHGVRAGG